MSSYVFLIVSLSKFMLVRKLHVRKISKNLIEKDCTKKTYKRRKEEKMESTGTIAFAGLLYWRAVAPGNSLS